MIGPVERWSELGAFEPIIIERADSKVLPPSAFADAAADASRRLGLERQREPLMGKWLVIVDVKAKTERRIARSKLYSLAPARETLDAVAAHLEAIAKKHGPGRVWFLGEPGMLMVDHFADDGLRGAIVAGEREPLIVQVTYYGHEKQLEAVS